LGGSWLNWEIVPQVRLPDFRQAKEGRNVEGSQGRVIIAEFKTRHFTL